MKNAVCSLACAVVCLALVDVFAAGLPSGYTRVPFIQGDGSTARILTDYLPDPATDKIVADVVLMDVSATRCIWCSRAAGGLADSCSFFFSPGSGKGLFYAYGENQQIYGIQIQTYNSIDYGIPSAAAHYILTTKGATAWAQGAGEPLGTQGTASGTTASFAAHYPLSLFASYVTPPTSASDTEANWSDYGTQRLYSFKVYRNDELYLDLVPAVDSNGNVTLVNVTDVSFALTQSGTFTTTAVNNHQLGGETLATSRDAHVGVAAHATDANKVIFKFRDDQDTIVTFAKTFCLKEALIIGGGGSGGGDAASGGGAGGLVYLQNLDYVYTPGAQLSLGVGHGGISTGKKMRMNGANSYLTLPDQTYSAVGGGAGSCWNIQAGADGGSGGGGYSSSYGKSTQPSYNGCGFGNRGGESSAQWGPGGGGGGAGAAGGKTTGTQAGGAGGAGKQLSITGTATWYAGGGGCGYVNTTTGANGGSGGGGKGGGGDSYNSGTAGTDDTGGGGGGGCGGGATEVRRTGGKGGNGIVILQMEPFSSATPIVRSVSAPSVQFTSAMIATTMRYFGDDATKVTLTALVTPAGGSATEVPLGEVTALETATPLELTGLQAGTEYSVVIRATNDATSPQFAESAAIAFTTRSDPNPVISSFAVGTVGGDSVALNYSLDTWGLGANAVTLTVAYGTSSEALTETFVYTGTVAPVGQTGTITVGDLTVGTTYYFRLDVENDQSKTASSSVVSAKTPKDPGISSITVTNASGSDPLRAAGSVTAIGAGVNVRELLVSKTKVGNAWTDWLVIDSRPVTETGAFVQDFIVPPDYIAGNTVGLKMRVVATLGGTSYVAESPIVEKRLENNSTVYNTYKNLDYDWTDASIWSAKGCYPAYGSTVIWHFDAWGSFTNLVTLSTLSLSPSNPELASAYKIVFAGNGPDSGLKVLNTGTPTYPLTICLTNMFLQLNVTRSADCNLFALMSNATWKTTSAFGLGVTGDYISLADSTMRLESTGTLGQVPGEGDRTKIGFIFDGQSAIETKRFDSGAADKIVPVTFSIPANGYSAAPIREIGTDYVFSDGAATGPVLLHVAANSPAFLGDQARIRADYKLVDWPNGISLDAEHGVMFGTAHNSTSYFYFRATDDKKYRSFAAALADGKTASDITSIWYAKRSIGMAIIIR